MAFIPALIGFAAAGAEAAAISGAAAAGTAAGAAVAAAPAAAAQAAIGFGISEALREDIDIPAPERPPSRSAEDVIAAADEERRRRAQAFGRSRTLLAPRSTLGVPLPSIARKTLLGQ